MARAIGKVRSWVWWVAGFLCALAFFIFRGGRHQEADGFQPEYGVIDFPRPMYGVDLVPDTPPMLRQTFGETEKRKVNELADAYLAACEEPPDPSPQADEKIENARERITEELRGLGAPALLILRERAGAQQKIAAETSLAAVRADQEGRQKEACRLREKVLLASTRRTLLLQLCVRLEPDSERGIELMYGVRPGH